MLPLFSASSMASGGCGNISCPVDGWEEICANVMPAMKPRNSMANDYLKKLNALTFNHHGQGLDLQQRQYTQRLPH